MGNKNFDNEIPVKLDLPRSNWVLGLGISSIGLAFAGGFPGLISGIFALKLSKKAKDLYKYAPELYNKQSFGKIQAGKITAYIGIAFSLVASVISLAMFTALLIF